MRRRRRSPPGRAAAVAGGFTTVCCMPNTKPALDNEGQIEFVLREGAARRAWQRLSRSARSPRAARARSWPRSARCTQRGAIAFSDDGVGVADASVMRKALQYAKMFDAVLMQHCEEPTLSGGSMHAGLVSTTLGLRGHSRRGRAAHDRARPAAQPHDRLPLSRAAHQHRLERGADPPGEAATG